MKPAPFDIYTPVTLTEAIDQLASLGDDARVLAGGQTLIPALNMRMARPSALVDLGGLSELCFIREDMGSLHIGSMTRQRTIERSDVVQGRAKLFSLALPHVAHFQIRNRGTLGGSIAHNDPAAELPAVVAALDGVMTLAGRSGERRLDWSEFFRGVLETAVEPGEIITSITIPSLPNDTGYGFAEISPRHGDFALVGAAAILHRADTGSIDLARLALFGVGDGPVRVGSAERCLMGEIGSPDLWREAADLAGREIEPVDDMHASGMYRREAAAALVRRVLAEAWEEPRDHKP